MKRGRMAARLLSYLPQKRKCAFLLFVICLCCQAQDQNEVNKLVTSISDWGEGLNSPGTKLEAHLMTKQARNGADYGFYDFYLTGASSEQIYTIFQWPLGDAAPKTVMPAFVSANGRLCMREGECHDTAGPYVMLAFLAFPGLPHRIGIASSDKKYNADVTIIPNPVIGEDKGCSVEVIRAREDFSLAVIRGKGFQPDAEIKLTSNSKGEKLKVSIKVDASGAFIRGLGPGVKGKERGTDELVFKASSCSPTVSFHWGEEDLTTPKSAQMSPLPK
jgi:hypothetical protein